MQKRKKQKEFGFFSRLSYGASLVFLVVFAFSFFSNISRADVVHDQLDALTSKIKTYQKIVTLKDKEHDQLAADAQKLGVQTDILSGNIDENERRLADVGQQIESLESRISEKEKVIAVQKNILADVLRSYYATETRSNDGVSIVLASAADFGNALSGRDRLFETGSSIRETLSGIMNLRNSMSRERDLATEKKVEVASLKFQLEQQNAYLETSKKNKEALAAQAAADQVKYSGMVSDLQQQRKALEAEIEQLEAAKEGKVDLSAIPQFHKGILAYPVGTVRISQGYGPATCKTCGYTFHNGIDFSGSVVDTVSAAEGGKVVGVGNEGKYDYGKWIAIEHSYGLTTLYGHLSKQSVSEGDTVDRGEKIGLMGSTGNSTGPHLHFSVFTTVSFEVKQSVSVKNITIPIGASINPANYL